MLFYPTWHLLKSTDRDTVASFYAVRMLAQLIQQAAVLLTMVIYSHAVRILEHEGRAPALNNLDVLTKASLLALVCLGTTLSVCETFAMHLFPVAFAEGVIVYDPLLLLFTLSGVTGLLAVRLNLVEQSRLVFWAWVSGVCVTVGSTLALLGMPGQVHFASHRAALSGAAWAGVFGLVVALAVVAVLLRRRSLAPGLDVWWLIVGAVAIGAGWKVCLPVTLVLVAVALGSSWLFSPDQKEQLAVSLKRFIRRKTPRS